MLEGLIYAISSTRHDINDQESAGFLPYCLAAGKPECTDVFSLDYGDVPSAPHLFLPTNKFAEIYG